ncbi:MAG: hypothetical protein AB1646_26515 [Thermodesulfobacteriota bacterium]
MDFKTAVEILAEESGVSLTVTTQGKRTAARPTYAMNSAVDAWDYTDEHGRFVFRMARFDLPKKPQDRKLPKEFRPFRLEEGTWVQNLKGVRRYLYRRPRLLKAGPKGVVLLLEGEKCADCAIDLGFAATTSPGGANNWAALVKDGGHEPLRGRNVVIVPDRDKSGETYCQAVARSLLNVAASVTVVRLPGVNDGDDIVQFVEHHGPARAREELARLIEEAPQYEPGMDSQGSEIPESAAEDSGERTRPSKFRVLLEQLDPIEITYFHDQFKAVWACIPVDSHFENVRVKSASFRNYLTRPFFLATGEGCGREVLQQVKDLCSARALFEGKCPTLWYRSAWLDDRVLLDLGGPDWRAVEITAEGWRVVTLRTPPFRRFSHVRELPEPKRGGSVREILSVLPIKDASTRDLLCTWLATVVVPHVPRASLVVHGLQGSAKTFVAESLRECVDPSSVGTLCLSKDPTELVQCLDHHFLPVFDNLSTLPRWASDVLCRATTGLGHTKRELFSDDDDITYFVTRTYILNGISVCPSAPDLMDRVLLIEMQRIPDNERQSKRKLLSRLTQIKPSVLGGICDAVAYALANYTDADPSELPRLTDWAEWALPISEAVGVGKARFFAAHRENVTRQHREVNQNDPTAAVIAALMNERDVWSGNPTDLCGPCCDIADELRITAEKSWAKSSSALGVST